MQVVTAINGEDAMEALEEDTWPDIVFLDYHMGLGESGDEVRYLPVACQELKVVYGHDTSCQETFTALECVFNLQHILSRYANNNMTCQLTGWHLRRQYWVHCCTRLCLG